MAAGVSRMSMRLMVRQISIAVRGVSGRRLSDSNPSRSASTYRRVGDALAVIGKLDEAIDGGDEVLDS